MTTLRQLEVNGLHIGDIVPLNKWGAGQLTKVLGGRVLSAGDTGKYLGFPEEYEGANVWVSRRGDRRLVRFSIGKQITTLSIHEGVDYWQEEMKKSKQSGSL